MQVATETKIIFFLKYQCILEKLINFGSVVLSIVKYFSWLCDTRDSF